MSVRVKFGMQNVRKFKDVIDKLEKQIPGALNKAQRMEAEEIMAESVAIAPKLTGALVGSRFIRRSGTGYEMGYDAPHAAYLHEGYAGGFMPPAGKFIGGFPAARKKGAEGQRPLKFLERPMKRRIPSMGKRWKKRMLQNMNLG
jgi:hypothetical protein